MVSNLTIVLCPSNIESIIACLVHVLDLNLARHNELGLVLFFTHNLVLVNVTRLILVLPQNLARVNIAHPALFLSKFLPPFLP